MAISMNAVFVLHYAFAERIAMDAKGFSGFGKIIVVTNEHFQDEILFKFLHGLIKKNSMQASQSTRCAESVEYRRMPPNATAMARPMTVPRFMEGRQWVSAYRCVAACVALNSFDAPRAMLSVFQSDER